MYSAISFSSSMCSLEGGPSSGFKVAPQVPLNLSHFFVMGYGAGGGYANRKPRAEELRIKVDARGIFSCRVSDIICVI
jgi:hypothetical protein